MTLTAGIAGLYPPACSGTALQLGECQGPSSIQLAVLILSFVLLCVGAAGVRPCNLPFGMDQFDRTTELGRQGTNSFFNWYYTTNTAALIVALTVVVYIQENISWFIGFLIPSILMFLALGIFLHGANKYVYVPPEGSIFSGIAEVLVVAFKKRKQRLPLPVDQNLVLYNPPTNSRSTKLPLTQQYRYGGCQIPIQICTSISYAFKFSVSLTKRRSWSTGIWRNHGNSPPCRESKK